MPARRSKWKSTAAIFGGGVKNWEWIKKGVPLRVEIGPRDLESGNVAVTRRDQPVKSKEFLPAAEFAGRAAEMLEAIQQNLFDRAQQFRDANTRVDRFEGRILRLLYAEERRANPRSTAASRSRIGTALARSKSRSRTT